MVRGSLTEKEIYFLMEHRAEKGTLYYDEYETKDHTVSQCKRL